MFLSQLNLNGSRASVVRLLQSDENIHACIAASTPSSSRPLWRMDITSHGRVIYVVSDSKPDFTGFKERYGYPELDDSKSYRTAEYDRLMDGITAGQRWYFETVVNPTIKHQGKVIPLLTKEDSSDGRLTTSDWLRNKMSPAAHVDDLRLVDEGTSHIMKKAPYGSHAHMLCVFKFVRYRGILTVNDADELRHILTDGIGREKAYGCGLVTLSPYR